MKKALIMRSLPLATSAIVCAVFMVGVVSGEPAAAAVRAQAPVSERLLYSFQGGDDGQSPVAPLIADGTGALYGTTALGGSGSGTIYKLTPQSSGYKESILWRFSGALDGANPASALLLAPSGTFYGTTSSGGAHSVGVAFAFAPSGSTYTFTPLHQFGPSPDGANPLGTLIADSSGTLLGTTASGGTNNEGIVFSLAPSGKSYVESILVNFDENNGATPLSGLFTDAGGTLYGTTESGGFFNKRKREYGGTLFALVPDASGYSESPIEQFGEGKSTGFAPWGGVLAAPSGVLYGVTYAGGAHDSGAVYQLTPAGSTYAFSVLHSFDPAHGDGANPRYEMLVAGNNGALYGTTSSGGTGILCEGGCGTVFELLPMSKGYKEKVLYSFQGGMDGALPQSGLIQDSSGNLYGTTLIGGIYGYGTVFEVST